MEDWLKREDCPWLSPLFKVLPTAQTTLSASGDLGMEGWREPATLPLNPAAGWGIALVTSLALWWGIWEVVSSLVSAAL